MSSLIFLDFVGKTYAKNINLEPWFKLSEEGCISREVVTLVRTDTHNCSKLTLR